MCCAVCDMSQIRGTVDARRRACRTQRLSVRCKMRDCARTCDTSSRSRDVGAVGVRVIVYEAPSSAAAEATTKAASPPAMMRTLRRLVHVGYVCASFLFVSRGTALLCGRSGAAAGSNTRDTMREDMSVSTPTPHSSASNIASHSSSTAPSSPVTGQSNVWRERWLLLCGDALVELDETAASGGGMRMMPLASSWISSREAGRQ
jgi:hypothetical protein